MKIEINLDESRFRDLVDSELGKFNEEEIHAILKEAISRYVMESDVIGKLFYTKEKNYYGDETGEVKPTRMLEKLVDKIDVEDTLSNVKSAVQEVLNTDETIGKLAESLFYRFLAGRLSDLLWGGYDNSSLQNFLSCKVNQILDDRLNRTR